MIKIAAVVIYRPNELAAKDKLTTGLIQLLAQEERCADG